MSQGTDEATSSQGAALKIKVTRVASIPLSHSPEGVDYAAKAIADESSLHSSGGVLIANKMQLSSKGQGFIQRKMSEQEELRLSGTNADLKYHLSESGPNDADLIEEDGGQRHRSLGDQKQRSTIGSMDSQGGGIMELSRRLTNEILSATVKDRRKLTSKSFIVEGTKKQVFAETAKAARSRLENQNIRYNQQQQKHQQQQATPESGALNDLNKTFMVQEAKTSIFAQGVSAATSSSAGRNHIVVNGPKQAQAKENSKQSLTLYLNQQQQSTQQTKQNTQIKTQEATLTQLEQIRSRTALLNDRDEANHERDASNYKTTNNLRCTCPHPNSFQPNKITVQKLTLAETSESQSPRNGSSAWQDQDCTVHSLAITGENQNETQRLNFQASQLVAEPEILESAATTPHGTTAKNVIDSRHHLGHLMIKKQKSTLLMKVRRPLSRHESRMTDRNSVESELLPSRTDTEQVVPLAIKHTQAFISIKKPVPFAKEPNISDHQNDDLSESGHFNHKFATKMSRKELYQKTPYSHYLHGDASTRAFGQKRGAGMITANGRGQAAIALESQANDARHKTDGFRSQKHLQPQSELPHLRVHLAGLRPRGKLIDRSKRQKSGESLGAKKSRKILQQSQLQAKKEQTVSIVPQVATTVVVVENAAMNQRSTLKPLTSDGGHQRSTIGSKPSSVRSSSALGANTVNMARNAPQQFALCAQGVMVKLSDTNVTQFVAREIETSQPDGLTQEAQSQAADIAIAVESQRPRVVEQNQITVGHSTILESQPKFDSLDSQKETLDYMNNTSKYMTQTNPNQITTKQSSFRKKNQTAFKVQNSDLSQVQQQHNLTSKKTAESMTMMTTTQIGGTSKRDTTLDNLSQSRRPKSIPSSMVGYIKNHAFRIPAISSDEISRQKRQTQHSNNHTQELVAIGNRDQASEASIEIQSHGSIDRQSLDSISLLTGFVAGERKPSVYTALAPGKVPENNQSHIQTPQFVRKDKPNNAKSGKEKGSTFDHQQSFLVTKLVPSVAAMPLGASRSRTKQPADNRRSANSSRSKKSPTKGGTRAGQKSHQKLQTFQTPLSGASKVKTEVFLSKIRMLSPDSKSGQVKISAFAPTAGQLKRNNDSNGSHDSAHQPNPRHGAVQQSYNDLNDSAKKSSFKRSRQQEMKPAQIVKGAATANAMAETMGLDSDKSPHLRGSHMSLNTNLNKQQDESLAYGDQSSLLQYQTGLKQKSKLSAIEDSSYSSNQMMLTFDQANRNDERLQVTDPTAKERALFTEQKRQPKDQTPEVGSDGQAISSVSQMTGSSPPYTQALPQQASKVVGSPDVRNIGEVTLEYGSPKSKEAGELKLGNQQVSEALPSHFSRQPITEEAPSTQQSIKDSRCKNDETLQSADYAGNSAKLLKSSWAQEGGDADKKQQVTNLMGDKLKKMISESGEASSKTPLLVASQDSKRLTMHGGVLRLQSQEQDDLEPIGGVEHTQSEQETSLRPRQHGASLSAFNEGMSMGGNRRATALDKTSINSTLLNTVDPPEFESGKKRLVQRQMHQISSRRFQNPAMAVIKGQQQSSYRLDRTGSQRHDSIINIKAAFDGQATSEAHSRGRADRRSHGRDSNSSCMPTTGIQRIEMMMMNQGLASGDENRSEAINDKDIYQVQTFQEDPQQQKCDSYNIRHPKRLQSRRLPSTSALGAHQNQRLQKRGKSPLDSYLVGKSVKRSNRPQTVQAKTMIANARQSAAQKQQRTTLAAARAMKGQSVDSGHKTPVLTADASSLVDAQQRGDGESQTTLAVRSPTHSYQRQNNATSQFAKTFVKTFTSQVAQVAQQSGTVQVARAEETPISHRQKTIGEQKPATNPYQQDSTGGPTTFLNRHQRLKLHQKNLLLVKQGQRKTLLERKKRPSTALAEEDQLFKSMLKREAVRRDIKFACKQSSAHIKTKLQRQCGGSDGITVKPSMMSHPSRLNNLPQTTFIDDIQIAFQGTNHPMAFQTHTSAICTEPDFIEGTSAKVPIDLAQYGSYAHIVPTQKQLDSSQRRRTSESGHDQIRLDNQQQPYDSHQVDPSQEQTFSLRPNRRTSVVEDSLRSNVAAPSDFTYEPSYIQGHNSANMLHLDEIRQQQFSTERLNDENTGRVVAPHMQMFSAKGDAALLLPGRVVSQRNAQIMAVKSLKSVKTTSQDLQLDNAMGRETPAVEQSLQGVADISSAEALKTAQNNNPNGPANQLQQRKPMATYQEIITPNNKDNQVDGQQMSSFKLMRQTQAPTSGLLTSQNSDLGQITAMKEGPKPYETMAQQQRPITGISISRHAHSIDSITRNQDSTETMREKLLSSKASQLSRVIKKAPSEQRSRYTGMLNSKKSDRNQQQYYVHNLDFSKTVIPVARSSSKTQERLGRIRCPFDLKK